MQEERRVLKMKNRAGKKGASSWTPIETNQFCTILADLINRFMITLERKPPKTASTKVVFEKVLVELKEFPRGTLQKPERRSVKEKEDIRIIALCEKASSKI